jgi:hypothetical protein
MKIGLSLKPGDFSKTYNLAIRITKDGRSNILEQVVTISYLRTISGRSRIYSVIRNEEISINGQSPKYSIDQLSVQAGNVLYPLELEIGFDGKYLCVYNADLIKERWEHKKKNLAEYYYGNAFDKYISLMDRAVAGNTALNEVFERDFFTRLYFNALYLDYSLEEEKLHHFSISPVSTTVPLGFSIRKELKQQPDGDEKLQIHHNGLMDDPRTQWEINNGLIYNPNEIACPSADMITGRYDCKYVLNEETKAIERISARCSAAINDGCKTEMELTEIKGKVTDGGVFVPETERGSLLSKFNTLIFGENKSNKTGDANK